MPSTPSSTARRASSGSRIPLMTILPGQRAQPLDVGPGQARLDHPADRRGLLEQRCAKLRIAQHVADPRHAMGQRTDAPARALEHRPYPARRQARIGAKPVARIAFANRDIAGVHRQKDGVDVRQPAARENVLGQIAIAEHVELKIQRTGARRGDILERTDRERRQTLTDARVVGRASRRDLAARPIHAGKSHRPEQNRKPMLGAEVCRPQTRNPALRAGQYFLTQPPAREIVFVRAHRGFAVRAAVQIIEEIFGHALSRHFSQIIDVPSLADIGHLNSSPFSAGAPRAFVFGRAPDAHAHCAHTGAPRSGLRRNHSDPAGFPPRLHHGHSNVIFIGLASLFSII